MATKKNSKKVIALLLIGLLSFSVGSCGSDSSSGSEDSSSFLNPDMPKIP